MATFHSGLLLAACCCIILLSPRNGGSICYRKGERRGAETLQMRSLQCCTVKINVSVVVIIIIASGALQNETFSLIRGFFLM